jgi:hypothetical protein
MSKDASPKVPCVVCKEPIKQGAKLCIHCKCDQRWWMRFGASGSTLSLLVALVAVTTQLLPVLKEFMAPSGAVIETSVGAATNEGFSLVVTNIGKLPASIQRIVFGMGDASHLDEYPLYIDDNVSRTVEPGKTIVVKGGLIGGEKDSGPPFPTGNQVCALDTWFTEGTKNIQAHRNWFPCIFAIDAIIAARAPIKH